MGFGFANIAYSQEVDLISLATNGALNEQSEGVKVLSDEEMSEVKGWYLQMNFGTNNSKIYSNAWKKYQSGQTKKCGKTRFGTLVCL